MNLNKSIWHKNDKISLNDTGSKYSPIVEGLLRSRGITDELAESYLNPNIEDLYDPYELKGMKIAVDRITEAIKNEEKVVVYGDYDVDGITSISVLIKMAEVLNYAFDYYIPDRHEEGYGLSLSSVEKLKDLGADLIITVDCGITSVAECDKVKELGMDIIVTDHHQCQDEIPRALAVLNPKQDDCSYKFDMLAGVGIAFKLAQALIGEEFHKHIDRFIAIAAFGTIADIAPITDENRIMCKFGLKAITAGRNLGIKKLIEKTKLDGRAITCGHVGFSLAPKINAAGRIGNPKLGVELLTSYRNKFRKRKSYNCKRL
jgi:single-stranded-DNA-specific exonuclease